MEEVARDRVPARTTPTWEMELLVSGAAIFGLLQLLRLLDAGYFRAMNLSPQGYAMLLPTLWLYCKVGIVILLVTFLAHLWMRGYWVALVGLNSVYPGGVRWERMTLGPLTRARIAREPAESMDEIMDRADNRATRVFGVGFAFAAMFLGPITLVLIALLACLLVDAVTGGGYTLVTFFTVLALALLPWLLATIADHALGTWLAARHPRLADAIGSLVNSYARVLGFGSRSLMSLFASHEGLRRYSLVAFLVVMPVMIVISLQSAYEVGRTPFSPGGLSGSDPHSASSSMSAFYADQHGETPALMPLPRIPSRVVDGDYVELFVPYVPRLHGARKHFACEAAGDSEASRRARLDCLARKLDLRVDDKTVAVGMEATTDAGTGQPGLLAMVPVAALPQGRHEISLASPSKPAQPGGPVRRYRIPFWK